MSVKMPDLDQDVLARRAQIVAALRAIVPGEGVIDERARDAAVRIGRAHRLQAIADGGGTAVHDAAGLAGAALLP